MYTVPYRPWTCSQPNAGTPLNNVPLTRWMPSHERLATLSPYESLGVREGLFRCFPKIKCGNPFFHAWISAKEAFAVLTTRIASNITGSYIHYNTPQLTLQHFIANTSMDAQAL